MGGTTGAGAQSMRTVVVFVWQAVVLIPQKLLVFQYSEQCAKTVLEVERPVFQGVLPGTENCNKEKSDRCSLNLIRGQQVGWWCQDPVALKQLVSEAMQLVRQKGYVVLWESDLFSALLKGKQQEEVKGGVLKTQDDKNCLVAGEKRLWCDIIQKESSVFRHGPLQSDSEMELIRAVGSFGLGNH